MEHQNIIKALAEIGLSTKEIAVYLCLLQTGESAVQGIREHTSLNRVTIYPVLQRLQDKGFVSKIARSNKNYFTALPPKHILTLLNQKEQGVREVLGELERISSTKKKSTTVEVFRGPEAIQTFLNRIYSHGDKELWAYGDGSMIVQRMMGHSVNTRNMRILKKIRLNVLTNEMPEWYDKIPGYKSLTKIQLSSELAGFGVYIIFGKSVVGIQELSKDTVGIIIENESIAKYHRKVFDMILRNSKR